MQLETVCDIQFSPLTEQRYNYKYMYVLDQVPSQW